jgi:hypothetical protein
MREQSSISDKPIFLDETGLRWRLVRIVLLSLITTVLILPIALTISILTVEVLPTQFFDLRQHVITAPASSYKTLSTIVRSAHGDNRPIARHIFRMETC